MKSLVKAVGYLEGTSFLVLMGIAMPMKYIGDDPTMVSIIGSIHGFLFLTYLGILFLGVGKHWNFTALIHGFIAAILPAGPFVFERMMSSSRYQLEDVKQL